MSRACVIFGSGVAVEEVQPRGRAEGGGRAVVVVCGLRWENTCQPLSYRELIAHRGHFLPPGGRKTVWEETNNCLLGEAWGKGQNRLLYIKG